MIYFCICVLLQAHLEALELRGILESMENRLNETRNQLAKANIKLEEKDQKLKNVSINL
jgi:hypothetical protein